MAWCSDDELRAIGLRFGSNVRVDRSAMFFGAEQITIASNVRIDAWSLITAEQPIRIGNFVHVGAGAMIFGRAGVVLDDFSGLSPRACILTTSDDFVEGYLTNPTVPEEFKRVTAMPVVMKKHSLLGCGSVVLPGVTVGEGAAIGALSLVHRDVQAFAVLCGNPPRKVATRNEIRLRELEAKLLEQYRAPPL